MSDDEQVINEFLSRLPKAQALPEALFVRAALLAKMQML
jgi:hypothetical protein